MKLEQLFEMDARVKQVADKVINDFAEEKSFNHNMIVAKVKELLSKDPAFKNDADKLNRALTAVSNYVRPEAHTKLAEAHDARKERQARLKSEIEAGKMPVVYNASGVSDQNVYTMGDLQALGWSSKTYTHDSSGEVDGWERSYSGPKPFKLHTSGAKDLRVIQPGTEII